MTLSEIYTEIYYRLNVASGNPFWSDTQILDAINEGYQHFAETTLCYKKFKPLQVSADTSTYDLPSDLIKLLWVGYDKLELRNISGRRLDNVDENWLANSGTPGYYTHALGGLDQISLYLQPDTAGTTLTIDWATDKDTAEGAIYCLTAFDDYLYAGTGANGKIYRSQEGSTWTEVEDLTETKVYSLAVFESALYAGCDGKIYKSTDGTTYTEAEDITEDDIWALHVFEEYIYAGCDEKIYRSADGSTWAEVKDLSTGDVRCFATFNDKIYAGHTGDGKIYSSSDGETWAEAGDLGANADNPYCMLVFENALYVGSGDSGKIFKSTDGATYTEVVDTTQGNVWALAEFDDHIYAAADDEIWFSPDGSTWTEDEDTTETDILSLAAFKNKLYAGSSTGGKIFVKEKLESMSLYTYYSTYYTNLLLFYAYADVPFDNNEWTSREVALESCYHWALVYYALYMLFKENNEAQDMEQSNFYKLLYADLVTRKIAQQKSIELMVKVENTITSGLAGDGPFLPGETYSTYEGQEVS